jgi:hypothetical protein
MTTFSITMTEEQVDKLLTYIESILDLELLDHERDFYNSWYKLVDDGVRQQLK